MGLGEEGPEPPEYKRFPLQCRTVCRFQLRGYKFCVEGGKSVGQGNWQHLQTVNVVFQKKIMSAAFTLLNILGL